jgi:hypothetical protein
MAATPAAAPSAPAAQFAQPERCCSAAADVLAAREPDCIPKAGSTCGSHGERPQHRNNPKLSVICMP